MFVFYSSDLRIIKVENAVNLKNIRINISFQFKCKYAACKLNQVYEYFTPRHVNDKRLNIFNSCAYIQSV